MKVKMLAVLALSSLGLGSALAAPMECYGTATSAATAIEQINFQNAAPRSISFDDQVQKPYEAVIAVTIDGNRTYVVSLDKSRDASLRLANGSISESVRCTVRKVEAK